MRRKDRQVTEPEEICKILNSCKTCRVAMQDEQELYIVPLSYGYEFNGEILTLYFHSAKEGRKMQIWQRNPAVCFEISREGEPLFVETPCNSGYYFSSLIGWGTVSFLAEPAEKCKALSLLFSHQTGKDAAFTEKQADTVCVYKIVSAKYTAKRKQ